MKQKWALLALVFTIVTVLIGCEPLLVLDPKGPQAETLSNTIWLSIITMAVIVIVVITLLVIVLVKYRASKQPDDYEPPHIEGNPILEGIIIGIPILIVAFLSVVSVVSTYQVESVPEGYEDKEPLVIYASSSNWKWHFSYPEEDIETLNYVFLPTDRPVEFRLYSFGPITSFWIPQLGGQKYAMADMVTTLHLAAEETGDFVGRNANFSGEGFAENTFIATVLSPDEYDTWIEEIHATADPITEDKFDELLEPGHLGQMTFTGTHLDFLPAPEGEHGGHNHGSDDSNTESHDEMDHEHEHESEHSNH
ncbi:cytochrome aa3 quinol oxidase subunit II [Oceanobacillus bengalensis]|uniref:Quinol oxidase polypeptide II n=1 Tax=Oceanobacillus bengalensis TaxID=1435466 RepID=A0A494Z4S1_9BACI|nr:cytochrome aa3 quinol oxidase subunit II [Oceanobacillus bengalensis]RKQ17532.1 cytochrome aa3 quinol oxidase subunit II [Oceanobacillus bengalensis]